MLSRALPVCRAALRTPPPSLFLSDHHALDEISVLQAVGFQGLIQATRDSTGAAFVFFRDVVLPVLVPLLVAGLAYAGLTAYSQGKLSRDKLSERDFGLLAICVLIDLFGGSSIFFSEASDIVWAPVSVLFVGSLFDSPLLGILNGVKELLPLTDVLPVATLGWLLAYVYPESDAARKLGVRRVEPPENDDWFDKL